MNLLAQLLIVTLFEFVTRIEKVIYTAASLLRYLKSVQFGMLLPQQVCDSSMVQDEKGKLRVVQLVQLPCFEQVHELLRCSTREMLQEVGDLRC